MNIPGMMGRGGMMGGQPSGPAEDTPQVDTAENVQISSLALLKMLKHGASAVLSLPAPSRRDRALSASPRAGGPRRGSLDALAASSARAATHPRPDRPEEGLAF